MPSKFAEKIIKSAKTGIALHLNADDTRQLATELGQMSTLIMKLIHGDLTWSIEPAVATGLFVDAMIGQLTAHGLSLSASETHWWGKLEDSKEVFSAGSLTSVLSDLRKDAGLKPPSPAILQIDGESLYKRLQELHL